ncbi:CPBP family intramembrane metalloprotease [Oscillospiraceae bacterium HV4-5-C5C]|nr:CPBP family intramembrane metalloprotease [Oscillospiraceae bacterium HV4-5-C5C]
MPPRVHRRDSRHDHMKKDTKPTSDGQPSRSAPPTDGRHPANEAAAGRPLIRRLPLTAASQPAGQPEREPAPAPRPATASPAAVSQQDPAVAIPPSIRQAPATVKDTEAYYHYEERYWVTDPQTGEKKVVIKRRSEPQDLRPRRSKITIDLSAVRQPQVRQYAAPPVAGGRERQLPLQPAGRTVALPSKRLNQLDFEEEIGLDVSVTASQTPAAASKSTGTALNSPTYLSRRVAAPVPRLRPQHLEPSEGTAPVIDRGKLASRLEQQRQQQQLWKEDLKFFNEEVSPEKDKSVPGFLTNQAAVQEPPEKFRPSAEPVVPQVKTGGQSQRSHSHAAGSGARSAGSPTAAGIPTAAGADPAAGTGPVRPPVSRVIGRLVNPLQQPEIKRPQEEAAPSAAAAPVLTDQPHFDPIQFESLFADFNDSDEADEAPEPAVLPPEANAAAPEASVPAPEHRGQSLKAPAAPQAAAQAEAGTKAPVPEARLRLQAMEAEVKQSADQNAVQLPPREPEISLFESLFDEPVSLEPPAAEAAAPETAPADPERVQSSPLLPRQAESGKVEPEEIPWPAATPAGTGAPEGSKTVPGSGTVSGPSAAADPEPVTAAESKPATAAAEFEPVTAAESEPATAAAESAPPPWAAQSFVTADQPLEQPDSAVLSGQEVSPTLDFSQPEAAESDADQSEPLMLGTDYPAGADPDSDTRPGLSQRIKAWFPLRKGQAGFALLLQTAVLALLTAVFPAFERWSASAGKNTTTASLAAAAAWLLLTSAAGWLLPLLLTKTLYRPRDRYYHGEGQTDLSALLLALLTGFPAAVFAAAFGTWLQSRWPLQLSLSGPLASLASADTATGHLLQVVVLIVIPAILAELLYRGLVQADLARTGHTAIAIILQALIYALFPGQPGLVPVLLPLGLLLGVIRRQTDQLTPVIAAHLSINLTLVLGWPYLSSRLGLQAASTAEPKYLLILAAAGLLITLLLFALLRHHLQQLRQPFEQTDYETDQPGSGRQRLYYVAYDENSTAHKRELWESEAKQQGFFFSIPLTILALLLQILIMIW